jgi:hypothetical protein
MRQHWLKRWRRKRRAGCRLFEVEGPVLSSASPGNSARACREGDRAERVSLIEVAHI